MAQFWTCPCCGANLDLGETCDCKDGSADNKEEKIDDRDNNLCTRFGEISRCN